ncbi:hypothetical protein CHUAL_003054 [Chamberlinius hualienensis]
MIPDTMTDRFPLNTIYEDGGGGVGVVSGCGGSVVGVDSRAGYATTGSGCIELRSGSVTLIGSAGSSHNLRVILKVYRTSLEHFAVLYPDKLMTCCKPIGFINLKNCNVGCWRRTLQIAQRSCDGGVLTFDCGDVKETKMWLEVMENKSPKFNSSFRTINNSLIAKTTASNSNKTETKQMRMNICNNRNLPIVQEEAADLVEE